MPASSHSKINALARGDTEVRQCFSPDELVLSYRTLILPKQTSDTGATPIEGSCPHKRKNTHTGTRAAGQVPAPRTCGHLPCRFQPCLGRAKSSPYHSFSVSGCCCSAPPSAASACADPSSRRCQRLAGGRVSREPDTWVGLPIWLSPVRSPPRLLGQPGQVPVVERLDVRVRRGPLHPDGGPAAPRTSSHSPAICRSAPRLCARGGTALGAHGPGLKAAEPCGCGCAAQPMS